MPLCAVFRQRFFRNDCLFRVIALKVKKRYLGVIYIVLSAFCFALMNTFVRLSGDIPSVQKSFFRNLVALIFAAALLIKNGSGFHYKKGNLRLLIARSLLGTAGILCNFYAVDHLVLSDASMLNKMSPFFVIIFSYIFLHERINKVQAAAVIIAFLGSLLIIKPTFDLTESFPAIIGLCGGICAGAAYTAVRELGNRGENGKFVVFFFSAFSCLVTLPFLIFQYQEMSLLQLFYLLCAGLSAAGGQFAITAAYYHAPAKEISVYDYSQIIFSALIGFFVFGQVPDIWSFAGYIIICLMAVWMFVYNLGKTDPGKTDPGKTEPGGTEPGGSHYRNQ